MVMGWRKQDVLRYSFYISSLAGILVVCTLLLSARSTVGKDYFAPVFASWQGAAQHTYTGQVSPAYAAIEADDYISVDSLWLRDGKGRPHFVQGMNYWSCMNLAAEEEAGGDQTRLQREMSQMAAAGINHLRVMAATQGAQDRPPFRVLPALQIEAGHWDERLFVGLDKCIAEAGERGMRLTMVLGNTWQWTGGHAQLYAWSSGRSIPYPRSWDLTVPPQRSDNKVGWGNWTTGSDDFVRFQARLYSDEKAQRAYRAHLDKVLHRRNTITGRIYSQDATIMSWEPVNEPTSATQEVEDRLAMNNWHNQTAHYIKAAAPHQLVTTGYEAKQGQQAFDEMHTSTAVDYACAHLWPQIWGHYDMLDSSKENAEKAKQWALEYIMKVQSFARRIGKPILLEEFGMPRDNWVNNVSKSEYLYDTSAPTTSRDVVFKAINDLVASQFKSKQGLIGLAPWSYGGIYRSHTQRYNNQGILLAGDPPQEPPGWFSILDTDYAMDLIYQMHRDIQAFVSSAT